MTEKTLKEAGDKVKEAEKKEIEIKVEALKKVKDADDQEAIDKAATALEADIQKVGAAMYQQAQGAEKAKSVDGEFKKK
jgi:molecular chaperone DnaK